MTNFLQMVALVLGTMVMCLATTVSGYYVLPKDKWVCAKSTYADMNKPSRCIAYTEKSE